MKFFGYLDDFISSFLLWFWNWLGALPLWVKALIILVVLIVGFRIISGIIGNRSSE
jgi:hypothetical protein